MIASRSDTADALDRWAVTSGRPLRLLLAETWDPDGAMFRWLSGGLSPAAVEVLTVPTQEAVGLVGPGALSAAWRAIAAEFQPDLVLVHPPYDYLDLATITAMQAGGARVVAFAFDEPLFASARATPAVAEAFVTIARAFDAYLVTGAVDAEGLSAQGIPAQVFRFCTNEMPFEESAPVPALLRPIASPLERSAVLIGRPYARRIQRVTRLAEAGVPVHVYGHGWSEEALAASLPAGVGIGPPLQRGAMNEALRKAGAVLTTGDWEQEPLAMVKYRILEAAIIGAPQAVQASPDLAGYFERDEIAIFSNDSECIAQVQALLADPAAARSQGQRARARTLRDHLAATRLGALVDGLALSPQPSSLVAANAEAPTWELLSAMIAHDAERRGAVRLAAEAYQRLLTRTGSADAAAGLGRLALAVKILEDGPETHTFSAARPATTTAVGLYAQIGSLPGPGLGHMAFVDPTAERLAVSFALDPKRFNWSDPAVALSPDTVIVMASLLELPEEWDASVAPAWQRLFEAAVTAKAMQAELMVATHRERWLLHLADLRRS